jgi:group I intron endonuclease
MAAIYQITSQLKPDKIYIGSAIDIKSRWNRHISELRKGKHGNRHLLHHYNKYGENDLVFSVVKECEPVKLLYWEQFYIDLLKPSFNICANAGSRFGVLATFATREKIKASWKHRSPISMESRLFHKK